MVFFPKNILSFLWGIGFCAAVFLGNSPTVFAVERVLDFSSSIEILENSSLRVVERIEYDFDTTSPHAIERILPTHVTNESGENKPVTVDILSVTDERAHAYVWKEEVRDSASHIFIEDLSPGSHTYVITYEVHGALFRGDDTVEFSWGVSGGGWKVPISTLQATVKIPASLGGGTENRDIQSSACQLRKGEDTSNCFGEIQNTIALFSSSRSLVPEEEMRISMTFSKDQVSAASAHIENAQVWFFTYRYLAWIFGGVVLLLGVVFVWRKKHSKWPFKSS